MDNSMTTWIIVALLVLLIGAAIFMLLRRPGGDDVVEGRDAPIADRDRTLDGRDRDGMDRTAPEETQAVAAEDGATRADEPFDQSTYDAPADTFAEERDVDTTGRGADVAGEPVADEDQGRWRDAAAIGAMGAAGAGAAGAGVADRDERRDERPRDDQGYHDDQGYDERPQGERTADDDVHQLTADEIDDGARHEPVGDEDQGRWRDAAAVGAMGAAGAGAAATTDRREGHDDVSHGIHDDRGPSEEPVFEDGSHGAPAGQGAAEERMHGHRDDEPSVYDESDVRDEPSVYDDPAAGEDQGHWRDAAAIGAMGAAGAGVAADRRAEPMDHDRAPDHEGADRTDLRPGDEGYRGAPADEGYHAEPAREGYHAEPASEAAYQDEPAVGRDGSESWRSDEPLTADEVLDARGEGGRGMDDRHREEYPVGEESTTYRAEGGEAVAVDEAASDRSWDQHRADERRDDLPTDERRRDDFRTDEPRVDDFRTDEGRTDRTWDERRGDEPGARGDGAAAGAAGAGAVAAGATAADERVSAPVDEPVTDSTTAGGPVFAESVYGPGSVDPAEDGSGPEGWTVKGNAGSMLFHTADSPSYDAVRAEVWFESEEAARNAGFAHWDRRRR